MDSIVATLAVAVAGGLMGRWLRLPAGEFLGATVAVLLVQSLGGHLPEPGPRLRFAVEVVLGAMVGTAFTQQTWQQMGQVFVPMLAAVGILIVTGLVTGLLLARLGGLDLATALFSTTPGALSNMVLLANSLGANFPLVAALQTTRLLVIVIILPPLLKWLAR